MKIFVLSIGENIYSTKRMVEEVEERGHSVQVINHTNVNIAEHIKKFSENNVG